MAFLCAPPGFGYAHGMVLTHGKGCPGRVGRVPDVRECRGAAAMEAAVTSTESVPGGPGATMQTRASVRSRILCTIHTSRQPRFVRRIALIARNLCSIRSNLGPFSSHPEFLIRPFRGKFVLIQARLGRAPRHGERSSPAVAAPGTPNSNS